MVCESKSFLAKITMQHFCTKKDFVRRLIEPFKTQFFSELATLPGDARENSNQVGFFMTDLFRGRSVLAYVTSEKLMKVQRASLGTDTLFLCRYKKDYTREMIFFR